MRSRLLIVDDDPDLLVILLDAIQLRLPDSMIDTAPSADKALEQIKTVDYDAIVTDIKMPGMDGLALMQEIRKIRPSTPTLLMTAHGEHDLAVKSLESGAYAFIQNPWTGRSCGMVETRSSCDRSTERWKTVRCAFAFWRTRRSKRLR